MTDPTNTASRPFTWADVVEDMTVEGFDRSAAEAVRDFASHKLQRPDVFGDMDGLYFVEQHNNGDGVGVGLYIEPTTASAPAPAAARMWVVKNGVIVERFTFQRMQA